MIQLDWLKRTVTLVVLLAISISGKAEEAFVMCDDTLDIDLIGSDVAKGDEVCVEMYVTGWTDLNSLQFTITWDPTVLEFIDVRDVDVNNVVADLNPATFGLFQTDLGIIRFVWFDNNVDGESAPDNFFVGRICFKAIGAPGAQTDVVIGDIPVKYEALDTSGRSFCLEGGDEVINITIPTDLCVVSTSCASRTSTGNITITPFGGTPPYTVNIPSIGVVNDMINNSGEARTYGMLSPGSYTVLVMDGAGNDTTMMLEVVDAEAITIDTVQLIVPPCSGDANGLIRIAADGGVPPYSYLWSGIAANGQTRISRLPAGFYSVTVKDSLGCEATATFDLQKDQLQIDTNIIQYPSCAGVNDGIIEAFATGGTPFSGGTYNYTWSINQSANGMADTSRNDRLGGSGYVVVEDAAGCTDTLFFDLPASSDLSTTIQIDSVNCFGDSTGRVTIVAGSMGSPNLPYRFFLFRRGGPVVTGGSVLLNEYRHDNLWAGQFVIRVDDNAGCSHRDTFEVEQPDPLEVIILDADTSAGCSPGNDAFLEVNGFGGNPGNYSFQWDYQNATTPRIDSLVAGNYAVEVTDRKGCITERIFEIRGSVGPTITGFDIQGIGCAADTSGRITVLYTQGDTTIDRIEWNVNQSGETITGLGLGQYIVTITDHNGCTATDTAVIDAPMTTFQISSVIIDTPSCNGSYDGFIQVNVSGGIRPYTFQWNNNSMDSILTNINAGQWIISIRDNSNCPPIVDTFDLPDPPSVDIMILDIAGVSCNDDTTCNGRVIATASGGPDPSLGYNFIWPSGELGMSSLDTAFNLCKDEQLLIVANGDCADSVMIDIPAPPKLNVDFSASELIKPSCFGDDDGSISIVTTGGTGTKRVRWDLGPTTNMLTNLPSGNYGFFVEDDNGCLYRDSVELRDPTPLEAFILDAATREISCPGDADGRIAVSWRGGNAGPASFSWIPIGVTDSVASDLGAGTYEIWVTDSRGCMDSVSYTLVEPQNIIADFPSTDSVDCFGGQLPVTIIGASGGNGPEYTFAINNGPRRDLGEEIDLFAGNYNVSVFDKDGCRVDSTFTIHQPGELTVDIGDDVIEIDLGDSLRLCFQANIPFSRIADLLWSPSGQSADSTNGCIVVKPGNDIIYFLEIADDKGCTASDQVQILVNKNRRVFAPNVFNPFGNVNTKWQVLTGRGVKQINKIEIYDRWGELIYRVEDPTSTDGWDGTYLDSNKFAPSDVYVYVVEVEYLDNEVEIRRGDITLIR